MSVVPIKSHLASSLLLSAAVFVVVTWLPDATIWRIVLGAVLLLGIILVIGQSFQTVLRTFFGFQPGWFVFLLSCVLGLSFLGYAMGAAIVFYRLTALMMGVCVFATCLFSLLVEVWASRQDSRPDRSPETMLEQPVGFLPSIGIVVYFFLLAGLGFYLLAISRTGAAILSPWQALRPEYILVFGVATLILGLVIISRVRSGFLLFLLTIHFFLLASYLPFSHTLLYGADGWRHAGQLATIVAEQPLITAELRATPSLGAYVSTLSYSQFWGILALFARVIPIDLLPLLKWFQPIMFAIVLPSLLYLLGRLLGWTERRSLLLVWLAALPFALQVAGSFTLPVNLGFLFWLASLLLLLRRLAQPRPEQWFLLGIFGVLSLFGYSLFTLLFWLSWLAVEVLLLGQGWSNGGKRFTVAILALVIGLVIPAGEIATHYSQFSLDQLNLAQVQQLVGNFSVFYLASGPRPHDIATGNILFNQVPTYAFVPWLLTAWPWWLVLAAVAALVLAAVGFVVAWWHRQAQYRFAAIMSAATLLSYVVSRYFLTGEHIFARRLDVVLAFWLIVLIIIALHQLTERWQARGTVQFPLAVGVIIAAAAIAASYSLGPDTATVSVDEYAAMKYIAGQESFQQRHCVIADTYPLLALEAASGRRIIGGGFPIDQYFAQPELQEMWRQTQISPDLTDWDSGFVLTKAKSCWLMTKATVEVNYRRNFLRNQQFGDVMVWQYTK